MVSPTLLSLLMVGICLAEVQCSLDVGDPNTAVSRSVSGSGPGPLVCRPCEAAVAEIYFVVKVELLLMGSATINSLFSEEERSGNSLVRCGTCVCCL